MRVLDSEINHLIDEEQIRQRKCLSLIASENIVSESVRRAVGSILTNKYAEGYPHRRYYGGCSIHDEVETLAINRAKELFHAEHANVQPHCGSSANLAAYFSLLNAGDTILAMSLDHGGHLTHGSPVNFSGKLFKFVFYGVTKDTNLIDFDEVRAQARLHRPKMIIAGASAYSRFIDFKAFREIADEVNAYFLVDMAHIAGLVAAGLHPSPIPFADVVTSTTHKTLRGARGGLILCKEQFKKVVDSAVFPGLQGGPLMHEIAGKAVCFKEAQAESFKNYQAQVLKNCKTLETELLNAGFKLVAKGSDNHLLLIDLTACNITGKDAEALLSEIGLVVNKNKIPYDTLSPTITSGIRLGTPSVTSRGMVEEHMRCIASLITDGIIHKKPIEELKHRFYELMKDFS